MVWFSGGKSAGSMAKFLILVNVFSDFFMSFMLIF